MTTIAQKLKLANFTTHFVGKWHCGARSPANLPANRGFDTSLGFLKGMEDHFNQMSNFDGYQHKYLDLWDGEGPDKPPPLVPGRHAKRADPGTPGQ